VDSVVDALEHGGVVKRGYLGVAIQAVSQDMAESVGLKTASGAIVDQVTAGTPAAEAGLKPGDVITKVNGQPVKDASDLTIRIGSFKPGDKVQLTYLRDGADKTVDVKLATLSNEKVAEATDENGSKRLLGVELAPARQVSGAGDKGVVVVNVDPNGAAADKGIAEGDVILEVAGKPVSDPAEVKADIAAARQDGKKAVLMRVHTASGDRFVAIPFPKA
jgi:serine protease Do